VPAVPLVVPVLDDVELPTPDPLAALEDIEALLSVYVGLEKELRAVDDEFRPAARVVPVEDEDVVDPPVLVDPLVPVVDPLVPLVEPLVPTEEF